MHKGLRVRPGPRFPFIGRLEQPGFLLFWIGQSVSRLGSQVTLLALPLTAILVLDAAPAQVGLLTAAGFAPGFLGLFAGVWTDRLRRRPLLVASDVLRALLLATVPLSAWLGVLRIEQLYAVQVLVGAATVPSNAAALAYLPTLVRTEKLVSANSQLAASGSAARLAGPGVAGALVELVSAPFAILVDALSFAFSAACLLLIRVSEPPIARMTRQGFWPELREGLHLVVRSPLLGPIALAIAVYNFFAAVFVAAYTLFLVRDLGLEPALIGIVVACGGLGGVLGGLMAPLAERRLGIGPAIVSGTLLLAIAHLAAPLASGPPWVVVPLLASGGLLANFGLTVSTVNQASLTQHLIPQAALGRVSASHQFLITATVPFGALLSGVLGEAFGMRATVLIAALGTIAGTLPLLLSPLRSLRVSAAVRNDEELNATAPRGDDSDQSCWAMSLLPRGTGASS
jgi:MFS family permease